MNGIRENTGASAEGLREVYSIRQVRATSNNVAPSVIGSSSARPAFHSTCTANYAARRYCVRSDPLVTRRSRGHQRNRWGSVLR